MLIIVASPRMPKSSAIWVIREVQLMSPTRLGNESQCSMLVEIGPKGGRRHNSPLKALPSLEGVTAEGPLGDGRKALSLLLP
jgi:hypothetical protein